jgi:hypothetical protein
LVKRILDKDVFRVQVSEESIIKGLTLALALVKYLGLAKAVHKLLKTK